MPEPVSNIPPAEKIATVNTGSAPSTASHNPLIIGVIVLILLVTGGLALFIFSLSSRPASPIARQPLPTSPPLEPTATATPVPVSTVAPTPTEDPELSAISVDDLSTTDTDFSELATSVQGL